MSTPSKHNHKNKRGTPMSPLQKIKSTKINGKVFSLQGGDPMPRAQIFTPPNQVYMMSKSYNVDNVLTTSTTLPTFSANYFAFSGINDVSALSSVFDQYKMFKIEVWLVPTTLYTSLGGLLSSVIDYDDANVLTSTAEATDYANCMTSSAVNGHYRTWMPHIAIAAYNGAFTGYSNKPADWIDCSSPNVQHYGLKLACEPTSVVQVYNMVVRILFGFKNVR